MRKSTFSESQRMAILATHYGGQSVEDICRSHQISPATFYKWKKRLNWNLSKDKIAHKTHRRARDYPNQRLNSAALSLLTVSDSFRGAFSRICSFPHSSP